jgi:hypothetical protein
MTEAKALRVRLRREGTRPVDGSRQRACRDIEFQQALLVEATQMLLDGNLDKGRAALRSCINVGFENPARRSGRSPRA